MTATAFCRGAALGVGGFQLLANAMLLWRGVRRLPEELAKESASPRLALLLRTAWVYGMLGNVCVSVVLLLVAGGLGAGDGLARRITSAVALYYLLVGAATYLFAPGQRAGLLLFSAMGAVLIAALWLSR